MGQLNSHQRRLLFLVVMVLLVGIGFKIADRNRRAIDFDIRGVLDGYKYTTAISLTADEVKATTLAVQADSTKQIKPPQIIPPKLELQQTKIKSTKATGKTKALPLAPIDINVADSLDIQKLPGIGPVLAGRIIACRDSLGGFKSPGDLLKVKGIGEKKLAKIQPYVKF
jgi:competence ComEA-like helix-hairpin-helix protein